MQYIGSVDRLNRIIRYSVATHNFRRAQPTMQQLEVFQSLWAMSRQHTFGKGPDLAAQFRMIDEAGFAGVDIVYGDFSMAEVESLLQRHKLACTITAFPDCVQALSPAIDMAAQLNARHINIIGKVYPFSPVEGAEIVNSWLNLCHSAGIVATIETHRDCITTDLHYTLQLMDAAPAMPLCADLSHFVVGREFSLPLSTLVQSQIETILDNSIAFQGRIASREQIQVPINFPQHKRWVELFQNWWAYGFRSWQRRSASDATLNFLCELGPPEYAISDADGRELSDRWQEALQIKEMAESIWREIQPEHN